MTKWWEHVLRGIGTITLFPPPLRTPYTGRDPVKVDAEAIAGDWRAVGDDVSKAMKNLEGEHEQPDTPSS